ncbi:MAG: hypothetical protein MZW92_56645 [Comamonadaceae bacterium]|nr:hypothetical protein [Comamonadaceae bacterium]
MLVRTRRAATRRPCKGSFAGAIGPAAVHARQHQPLRAWTSTATAASTCRPAPPTRSAAWPTTWPRTAGSAGMATHYAVAVPVDAADRARAARRPTSCRASAPRQFAERGAVLDDAGRAPRPARWRWWNCRTASCAPSYVAGTQNFYAITRYNRSQLLRDGGAGARRRGAALTQCDAAGPGQACDRPAA